MYNIILRFDEVDIILIELIQVKNDGTNQDYSN